MKRGRCATVFLLCAFFLLTGTPAVYAQLVGGTGLSTGPLTGTTQLTGGFNIPNTNQSNTSPSAAATKDAKVSDKECPAENDKQKYNKARKPYPAYYETGVNNQTVQNLYGKPCVDDRGEIEVVKGMCTAQDLCLGTTCYGTTCKTPDTTKPGDLPTAGRSTNGGVTAGLQDQASVVKSVANNPVGNETGNLIERAILDESFSMPSSNYFTDLNNSFSPNFQSPSFNGGGLPSNVAFDNTPLANQQGLIQANGGTPVADLNPQSQVTNPTGGLQGGALGDARPIQTENFTGFDKSPSNWLNQQPLQSNSFNPWGQVAQTQQTPIQSNIYNAFNSPQSKTPSVADWTNAASLTQLASGFKPQNSQQTTSEGEVAGQQVPNLRGVQTANEAPTEQPVGFQGKTASIVSGADVGWTGPVYASDAAGYQWAVQTCDASSVFCGVPIGREAYVAGFAPTPEQLAQQEAQVAQNLGAGANAGEGSAAPEQTVASVNPGEFSGAQQTVSPDQSLELSAKTSPNYTASAYGVCDTPGGCNSVEGAPLTAIKHPDAQGNSTNEIYTLDGYANGRYPYVTVAGSADQLGQTGTLKEITYNDPTTGETKTLTDVPVMFADKKGSSGLDVPLSIPESQYGDQRAINQTLDTQPYSQQKLTVYPTDGLPSGATAGVPLPQTNPNAGGQYSYATEGEGFNNIQAVLPKAEWNPQLLTAENGQAITNSIAQQNLIESNAKIEEGIPRAEWNPTVFSTESGQQITAQIQQQNAQEAQQIVEAGVPRPESANVNAQQAVENAIASQVPIPETAQTNPQAAIEAQNAREAVDAQTAQEATQKTLAESGVTQSNSEQQQKEIQAGAQTPQQAQIGFTGPKELAQQILDARVLNETAKSQAALESLNNLYTTKDTPTIDPTTGNAINDYQNQRDMYDAQEQKRLTALNDQKDFAQTGTISPEASAYIRQAQQQIEEGQGIWSKGWNYVSDLFANGSAAAAPTQQEMKDLEKDPTNIGAQEILAYKQVGSWILGFGSGIAKDAQNVGEMLGSNPDAKGAIEYAVDPEKKQGEYFVSSVNTAAWLLPGAGGLFSRAEGAAIKVGEDAVATAAQDVRAVVTGGTAGESNVTQLRVAANENAAQIPAEAKIAVNESPIARAAEPGVGTVETTNPDIARINQVTADIKSGSTIDTAVSKVDQAVADLKAAAEPVAADAKFSKIDLPSDSPIVKAESVAVKDLDTKAISALENEKAPEGYSYMYRGLDRPYATPKSDQQFSSDLKGVLDNFANKPDAALVRITVPNDVTSASGPYAIERIGNYKTTDVLQYPQEWFTSEPRISPEVQAKIDALPAQPWPSELKGYKTEVLVDSEGYTSTRTVAPDGTTVQTARDGSVTTTAPDGTVTVVTKEQALAQERNSLLNTRYQVQTDVGSVGSTQQPSLWQRIQNYFSGSSGENPTAASVKVTQTESPTLAGLESPSPAKGFEIPKQLTEEPAAAPKVQPIDVGGTGSGAGEVPPIVKNANIPTNIDIYAIPETKLAEPAIQAEAQTASRWPWLGIGAVPVVGYGVPWYFSGGEQPQAQGEQQQPISETTAQSEKSDVVYPSDNLFGTFSPENTSPASKAETPQPQQAAQPYDFYAEYAKAYGSGLESAHVVTLTCGGGGYGPCGKDSTTAAAGGTPLSDKVDGIAVPSNNPYGLKIGDQVLVCRSAGPCNSDTGSVVPVIDYTKAGASNYVLSAKTEEDLGLNGKDLGTIQKVQSPNSADEAGFTITAQQTAPIHSQQTEQPAQQPTQSENTQPAQTTQSSGGPTAEQIKQANQGFSLTGDTGQSGQSEIPRQPLPAGSYVDGGRLQNDQSGTNDVAPKADQTNQTPLISSPSQYLQYIGEKAQGAWESIKNFFNPISPANASAPAFTDSGVALQFNNDAPIALSNPTDMQKVIDEVNAAAQDLPEANPVTESQNAGAEPVPQQEQGATSEQSPTGGASSEILKANAATDNRLQLAPDTSAISAQVNDVLRGVRPAANALSAVTNPAGNSLSYEAQKGATAQLSQSLQQAVPALQDLRQQAVDAGNYTLASTIDQKIQQFQSTAAGLNSADAQVQAQLPKNPFTGNPLPISDSYLGAQVAASPRIQVSRSRLPILTSWTGF